MNKVLIIAAHPDDETYGVGGTIGNHLASGDEVCVLILTDGVSARHEYKDKQQKAAIEACEILQVNHLEFGGLPDQRLDSLPLLDVIMPISRVVSDFQPNIVYTHHGGDVNQDHRIVFQASLVACRPVSNNPVKELISYEVASSTEWAPANPGWMFYPNLYIDIVRYLDLKLAALVPYTRTHVSEVPCFPHPRSMEATKIIAQERGISVGLEAAEAFSIIRQIR